MSFADTFTRSDSATVGNGWTETDAAGSELLSNKLRITGGGNYSTNFVTAPASGDFTDGIVTVDFNVGSGALPMVLARADTGTLDGYLCYVASGNLLLNKYVTGTLTELDRDAATVANGTNYRFTFTLSGSSLTCVLRNLDTATDIATVTKVDTTHTGSGSTAVSTNTSGTVDYDNFDSTNTATVPAAAITGTITTGTIESDIVTGGKTIIVTLTDDTWIAAGTGPIGTTAQSNALLASIDSAQAEAAGWDAVVKANFVSGDLVRTSDTVATITVGAEAAYAIAAQETITFGDIANAILTTSATDVTPTTNTFTIDFVATTPAFDFSGAANVFKNNTGGILASETGVIVSTHIASTGVLADRQTGLTTDVSGNLSTLENAAYTLVPHHIIITFSGGEIALVRSKTPA